MPADSFESPLTLAACGGHQELAALLISRGADLEEVNDEGLVNSQMCPVVGAVSSCDRCVQPWWVCPVVGGMSSCDGCVQL